jgi:hypothetical protein
MEPLLAITCIFSVTEPICCTIQLVSSFQNESNHAPITGTFHGEILSRQLKLHKRTKTTSAAAIEPLRRHRLIWTDDFEVVEEFCHYDFARSEVMQNSLSMSNDLDDIGRSLETGLPSATSRTCPMLPLRRALSPLKRLSSRLSRPSRTVRWSRYTRDQKPNGRPELSELPVHESSCKQYDTESQQWNPESEKETSHLLAVSRTDGAKRNFNAPRLHLRRIWHCRTMTATRLLRLLGSISLLYPACMVVMSNYAITRGLFTGCNSWYQGVLQVSSSLTRFEKQIDNLQVSTLHIQPEFVSHPSPALMFGACMLWAVLEWAHYFSNENDKYQHVILASAICIGLLPAIGCSSNVLAVLLCMVPWAVHLGLVVSDVLHRSRLITK